MATFSLFNTSSMHRNYFFASSPMNFNSTLLQAPAIAQTSVPTFFTSSEKTEVENQQSGNEANEQDKEIDFIASLLMDFSKGVINASVAQDAFAKRKSDEIDSTPLLTKKSKRMPRSPSINTLVAEQTIACEEHSSKHLRCPMNCPNRRPGSKRMRSVPADESRSTAVSELETEEAEQVTTVQKNDPIQLVYQPTTKFFELPKPVEVEDYVQILKWAFLQLPALQGTFEDIFSVIRKNGWKELRNGTPREILLCKKNFLKYLENTFQLKGVDTNGEHIYFSQEFNTELSSENEKLAKKIMQKRRGRPAALETLSPSPSSDFTQSPINSAPGSPVSSLVNSMEPAFPFIGDEYYEDEEPGSPNYYENEKARKKGRRWLRFACEKHRKEHTKCGENCPSRRITYTVRGNSPVVESQ